MQREKEETRTGPAEDRTDPAGRAAEVRVRRIERDAAGLMVVHLEGREEPVLDARLARCFPWSLSDAYLSVRDPEGREVALVRDLDDLDPESRQVAEAELRDKVFNPRIRRVLDCRHEFGISSITAETDRGKVTFQIRGRDDVRLLSPTRALFRDVDGITYEVPDFNRLDPASQRHLRRYF